MKRVTAAPALRFQGPRRLVAGIACGFAGTMAAAAFHGLPQLSVLSSRWVSLPWLVANALVCCVVARAMFVAEARNLSSPRQPALRGRTSRPPGRGPRWHPRRTPATPGR